ncbi:uncharacterized protein C8A04DRAFT_34499 [Dichotomopilus funicola]|uniref:Uncharacterized protein n=1 Tax=Dichotomopilus funicola TaxID=1934379 RepID=A0AAN6V8P3_9PEZI|nr:hypothetical protein C8A04DRAFT_34499 [Dichotomopilus funicola]
MASLAAACRISARLASRKVPHDAARGFRTSAAALAAQNFTMPALSPTMTEGNIAAWRVKEGDKFSAGDVLLEIETDKATMDVEAQEDGILMKVMQADGSKGVQVGTRIAVIAEEGDDISALEIPADEKTSQPPQSASTEAPKSETPAAPEQSESTPSATGSTTASASKSTGPKRTFPLVPSVLNLLKENGLDESAVNDITPTGPQGRLLKGDVLAHLGKINTGTPAAISARFEKASHLDLSNIKVAAAKPAPATRKPTTADTAAPAPPPKSLVSLPVSLSAVLEAQARIHKTLGVFLPLSTFIARASELANDELPLPSNYQPSADELFHQLLGLDKVSSKVSRGSYIPLISSASSPSAAVFTAPKPQAKQKKVDILDILAAKPQLKSKPATTTASSKPTASVLPGPSTAGPNLFSLQVPKAEEKRATVFLERVKTVLETEPGRLVL